MRLSDIQRDWEVFAREGAIGIGAVRKVGRDHIIVYIEGYGDQRIKPEQIASVHDTKVVLALDRLSDDVRSAIGRAHSREEPDFPKRPPQR